MSSSIDQNMKLENGFIFRCMIVSILLILLSACSKKLIYRYTSTPPGKVAFVGRSYELYNDNTFKYDSWDDTGPQYSGIGEYIITKDSLKLNYHSQGIEYHCYSIEKTDTSSDISLNILVKDSTDGDPMINFSAVVYKNGPTDFYGMTDFDGKIDINKIQLQPPILLKLVGLSVELDISIKTTGKYNIIANIERRNHYYIQDRRESWKILKQTRDSLIVEFSDDYHGKFIQK